jgi:hypothetical protein
MSDPSIATEAEMLAAVEWWARARGFWRGSSSRDDEKPGWHVGLGYRGSTYVWHGPAHGAEARPVYQKQSASVLLAWAILVEIEPPPVDVGPCPDCRSTPPQTKRARRMKPGQWVAIAEPWDRAVGSNVGRIAEKQSKGSSYTVRWWTGPFASARVEWLGVGHTKARPDQLREATADEITEARKACPACSGSGRKIVSVPRLLLDSTTDATDRAELLVYADRLQAAGDPRGDLLAWALGLWMQPLTVAECAEVSPDDIDHSRDHTGDAVRWLEWLTWGREFERTRGQCHTCGGSGAVPGEAPHWGNPYGEPPEPCPDCDEGEVERRLNDAFERERQRQRNLRRGLTAQRGR